MTAESTTEVKTKIGGVPDLALRKALTLTDFPEECEVDWVGKKKKFWTIASIGTAKLEAENTTLLITEMANEILRLQKLLKSTSQETSQEQP
jgi:hypothetical protein